MPPSAPANATPAASFGEVLDAHCEREKSVTDPLDELLSKARLSPHRSIHRQ